jgi:hypothetical protein
MRLKFVDVRPIADSRTTLERRWTKSLWAVFTSKKSCRLSRPVRSSNSILMNPVCELSYFGIHAIRKASPSRLCAGFH